MCMRVLAVAAIIILSGCLGGADTNPKNDPDRPDRTPPPPPSTPTPPAPSPDLAMLLDFGWTDCDGFLVEHYPPLAEADAVLPGNRSAGTSDRPTGDTGHVRYVIAACDLFTASGSDLEAVVYGYTAVLLDDGSWYRLQMFASKGIMKELWTAAGYEVYADEYESDGPLVDEQFGSYDITGVAASGPGPAGITESWTDLDGRSLHWTGTETFTATPVVGRFTTDGGDPFDDTVDSSPDNEIYLISGSFTENELWLIKAS